MTMSPDNGAVRNGISPYQLEQNAKAAAFSGASKHLDDNTLVALLLQRFATKAAADGVMVDAKALLAKLEQMVDGRMSAIDRHLNLLSERVEAVAALVTPKPKRERTARLKRRRR